MNDEQDTDQNTESLLVPIETALMNIDKDIEETDRHATETLLHVENRVDATMSEIETLCTDVERAESQTEEELDFLILNQIEDTETEEIE